MKNIILLSGMCMVSLFSNAQSVNDSTLFDFWVGKWEVSWNEGNGKLGKGTNEVVKTLDEKVLQENFRILEGKSKGFKGTSISVFNKKNQTWKQAWADNQGGYFDFTGDLDGDKRIFKTAKQPGKDGVVAIQRMVFYDITEKSMTWDWEGSKDGGKTWNLLWRINYSRVK